MTTDLALPVSTVPSYGGLVLTPRPFAREEDVSLHALPDGLSVAEMIAKVTAVDPKGDKDLAAAQAILKGCYMRCYFDGKL